MHPNPAFYCTDRMDMLAFVAERGFAHIFVAGSDGPRVAHAPLLATARQRPSAADRTPGSALSRAGSSW